MKEYQQIICIKTYSWNELSEEEKTLVDFARQATNRSYAPYSHFHVGAAIGLANRKPIWFPHTYLFIWYTGNSSDRECRKFAPAFV